MALTPEGALLTEAHRLAQARLGALTVQQMLDLWRVLDVANLDASTASWLRLVVPLIQQQRQQSSSLAAGYYSAYRAAETGAGVTTTIAPTVDLRAAVTSLTVTGPVHVTTAMRRGADLARASELGQVGAARAAMRHVLNGGREQIIDSVRSDGKALGWARAPSGSACFFCAMLASRGPVYREDSADFQAHDHCYCSAEPVFSKDADWPAGAREYQQMWNDAKTSAEGEDVVAVFRRAVEDRSSTP